MASAGVIEGSRGRRASWTKATLSPVIEKRQAHMGAEVGEGHQDLLPANKSWPGLVRPCLMAPEGAGRPPHLDFRRLASKDVREWISVV